jgi:hypothetical protein
MKPVLPSSAGSAFQRSEGPRSRCLFLLFKVNETRVSRLRNFDTELPCSYCYESQPIERLESVAYAHTAADLHVRPWFSNRADLENRGRRERFKKYTMRDFPQCLDSMLKHPRRVRVRCNSCEAAKQVFESARRFVRDCRRHNSRRGCEIF